MKKEIIVYVFWEVMLGQPSKKGRISFGGGKIYVKTPKNRYIFAIFDKTVVGMTIFFFPRSR